MVVAKRGPLYMVTWRCTRNCVGNCLYCSYTREYAKETGFEVSLITSGFAFDKQRLYDLARNEVHVAVSIDGNREANDIIRGRGSYDKAVFAMKKLSENGILDCVVTTMTKYNIKDLEHPAKLAAEHGAKMIVYHNLVP